MRNCHDCIEEHPLWTRKRQELALVVMMDLMVDESNFKTHNCFGSKSVNDWSIRARVAFSK